MHSSVAEAWGGDRAAPFPLVTWDPCWIDFVVLLVSQATAQSSPLILPAGLMTLGTPVLLGVSVCAQRNKTYNNVMADTIYPNCLFVMEAVGCPCCHPAQAATRPHRPSGTPSALCFLRLGIL